MWWRLGPAAKKLIDEVVAECEMSTVARKAAASKRLRAIGIEALHKPAHMMATLLQELRNEGRFVADFTNGLVLQYEGRRVWMADDGFLAVMLLGTFEILCLSPIRTRGRGWTPSYHGTRVLGRTHRCRVLYLPLIKM